MSIEFKKTFVEFTYINHRGEREDRRVIPDSLEFICGAGHGHQPGWFLSGHDLDRNARRSFALSHIVLSRGDQVDYKRTTILERIPLDNSRQYP